MKTLCVFLFAIFLVNFCSAQDIVQICYHINSDSMQVGYHSEVDIAAISLRFSYTGYQIDTVEFLEPAQDMSSGYDDSAGELRIFIWKIPLETIPKGTDYLIYIDLSGDGSIFLDTVEASDYLANTLNYEEVDCSELGLVYAPESENEENFSLPENFELFQNYPNPFNPRTTISYELKEEFFVKLEIYDILGRKVKTLVSEKQSPGFKTFIWDGKNDVQRTLSSGVYLYRLEAGAQKETKKMILLK